MRLSLIGDFAALDDSGKPLTIAPSGARLLALLALNRHGQSRSCAAGTLWPDKNEERASANLRSTLWRLKSTRSVAIADREPDVLCLRPEVEVDLRRHEQARLEDDPPPEVGRLLTDLLEGWDDEWVAPFRVRWRQTRLHTLDVYCRGLVDQERFNEAVTVARQVLDVEPLRETVLRLLVRAELALEHRESAAAAISDYRELLGRECGAVVSPQMTELAAAVSGAAIQPRGLGSEAG